MEQTDRAMELPPLPERHAVLPALVLPEVHGMGGNTTVFREMDVFTADQMRSYAEQAVLAERERCARVCESLRDEHCAETRLDPDPLGHCRPEGDDGCDFVAAWNDAAAAIRKPTA